jgi:hypothetical protein
MAGDTIVTAATLSRQRRFVLPSPGDTLEDIARRELPELDAATAMERLQAWNMHIFLMRRPPGLLTGCDVVFVEPPLGA